LQSKALPQRASPRWFTIALLVGLAYFLTGRLFALPTSQVRVWRLAAWLVSAALFAAHIACEHINLRNSPPSKAFHVAIAVALGAFGLALAATVHSWLAPAATPFPQFLLALVVWPLITALPAFLVAYASTAVLARLWPRV
jgi:hypothetical protein